MAATATIAEGWNFAPQPRRRSRFTSLQAERSLGLLTRALCNTGFTATSGFGGWEVPDFLLTFLYPSPSAPLLKPDCPLPHSTCLQRRFPLLGTWGVGWSLRSGIRGSWVQILSHHAGGHCAHCLTSLSLSRQGEDATIMVTIPTLWSQLCTKSFLIPLMGAGGWGWHVALGMQAGALMGLPV